MMSDTEMFEVQLEFYTVEEVTPEIFARKVAVACARSGSLYKGERVAAGEYVYEYTGEVTLEPGVVGTMSVRVPEIIQVHP
jgi:hypothetical protein